jgi:hypothetical protein
VVCIEEGGREKDVVLSDVLARVEAIDVRL